MTLQLLRGRDLRPPSRREREPTAVSKAPLQTHSPQAQIEAPARKKALRFPVNRDARAFYRHFYPDTSAAEWNDWRWQRSGGIRELGERELIFVLPPDDAPP